MTLAVAITLMAGAILAMMLAVTRLLRGPSQADRIVALDVVFSANVALTGAISLITGRALFLDIGVGLAMVGFVATIVWARLIDAGATGKAGEQASSRVSERPRVGPPGPSTGPEARR